MMIRGTWIRMGMVGLALAASGCAGKQQKNRIGLLEDTNRNLTAELNRAKGELNAANRARENCDQALLAARQQADDLRDQLANLPVPEEAAPGWTAVPGGAMIAIEGSVLFEPGKNVLRSDARQTLDAIVSTVQGEYADKDILVFGHTDSTPIKKSGWDDNWQLSAERALAVVRHLSSHGVASSRLVACGCGEHRPRSPNDSMSGKARNRRVEIFAIDPQPQTGRS